MPREDNMIDRVARAIFRAGFHPDDSDETVEQCWTDWKEDQKPSFARARAAIEAMRDPTETELHGARDWSVKKYGLGVGNDAALGCWQAMIDAALSETPDAA